MFDSLRKSLRQMTSSFEKDLDEMEATFKEIDSLPPSSADGTEEETRREEVRPDGTRIVTTRIVRKTVTKTVVTKG